MWLAHPGGVRTFEGRFGAGFPTYTPNFNSVLFFAISKANSTGLEQAHKSLTPSLWKIFMHWEALFEKIKTLLNQNPAFLARPFFVIQSSTFRLFSPTSSRPPHSPSTTSSSFCGPFFIRFSAPVSKVALGTGKLHMYTYSYPIRTIDLPTQLYSYVEKIETFSSAALIKLNYSQNVKRRAWFTF